MENVAEMPQGLVIDHTSTPEGITDALVGYVTVLQAEPGMAFDFTVSSTTFKVGFSDEILLSTWILNNNNNNMTLLSFDIMISEVLLTILQLTLKFCWLTVNFMVFPLV